MDGSKKRKPGDRRRASTSWSSRKRTASAVIESQRIVVRLQDRIKQQGFTQRQIQEILGWGKSYLSDLMHGKVALRVEHVLLICDVIGASPAELFKNTEVPHDSSPERDVEELLKSFGHPIRVLGSVDEEALLEAARRRLPRARGVRKRYLADVVTWCENSIELNRRSERRRARTRGVRSRRRGSPSEGPLAWPDFEGYLLERYRQ